MNRKAKCWTLNHHTKIKTIWSWYGFWQNMLMLLDVFWEGSMRARLSHISCGAFLYVIPCRCIKKWLLLKRGKERKWDRISSWRGRIILARLVRYLFFELGVLKSPITLWFGAVYLIGWGTGGVVRGPHRSPSHPRAPPLLPIQSLSVAPSYSGGSGPGINHLLGLPHIELLPCSESIWAKINIYHSPGMPEQWEMIGEEAPPP